MGMTHKYGTNLLPRCLGLLILELALALPLKAEQLTQEQYKAERQRAFELCEKSNFAGAWPILEKLAAANPSDQVVLERLAMCIHASSALMKDTEARRLARDRAKAILLRAQKLGELSDLSKVVLRALNAKKIKPYSQNTEAQSAMEEGEAAFVQGNLDQAVTAYQRALNLDTNCYFAALFIGDMYFQKKENAKACEWFAKASVIDGDRETSYRYWGDALLAADKVDEARPKFVEAVVAEPSERAWTGLVKWADRTGTELLQPEIRPPETFSPEGKILLDPSWRVEDGTLCWATYEFRRAAWFHSIFAKEFPNEKAYRHTLLEEASVLREVAEKLSDEQKLGKIKSLHPSLAALLRLKDAGLIEAYVLFVLADEGIAQDYAAYRKSHRDKLRQYINEWVLSDRRGETK